MEVIMRKLQSTVIIIGIILIFGLIISGCDNTDTVSLVPSPPSNVTATVQPNNNVIISWDLVSDADGYKLYYYYNKYEQNIPGHVDIHKYLKSEPLSSSSILISGLYSGVTYSFGVTAYNSHGESEASKVYATTLPSIPDIPTNITASAASDSSIRINWSREGLADGYKVYRSETFSENYNEIALINSADSTSYLDTNLPINTTYYYKVSAYNERGESGLSKAVSSFATTLPVAAPSNFRAEARAKGILITDYPEIELKWDAVSNATSYIIYRSLTGLDDYIELSKEIGKLYLDSKLKPETTYYYKIAARNGIGDGPLSDPISATTPSLKPNVPTGLKTSNITTSSITVNWSMSSDASAPSYIIYRSLTDLDDYKEIGTETRFSISYTDKNVASETTYYYKILARNSYGDSPLSAPVSATTPTLKPNTPKGLSISASKLRVIIDWSYTSGAKNYVIYRSLTGLDDDYQIISSTASGLSYSDYNITPGTTYYYKVAARNEYGDSPLSDVISVTISD
jgi:fibronectin type 3 domain-containing protein